MSQTQMLAEQVAGGQTPGSQSARELISFHIGTQEFCVDIMQVREIRGWTESTMLPQAPRYVHGVINLRGAVLPIVDLAARLGLANAAPTDRSVIIVTQIGAQLVGLLVDAVSDILTVTEDMIQPTPDVASDLVKTFVRGLLAMEGRMISLISLDRVLPAQDLEAA
jgi:purine-binding chemotaxis protein CheW